MIKQKRVTYVDGQAVTTDAVVGIGSTIGVTMRPVRVMSDDWEMLPVADYITDEGGINSWTITDLSDATLDADDAAFERYRTRQYQYHCKKLESDAIYRTSQPAKGKTVKVVRGKSGKGLVGKVFAAFESSYGMGYRSSQELKLGIALDDTKHMIERNGRMVEAYANIVWVWARNVEVVDRAPIDRADIERRARELADHETSHQILKYRTKLSMAA